MKKILVLFMCFPLSLLAQKQNSAPEPAKPKLIVGIVVDQMRADYISKYWNKFGNDGFRKLVNEGFTCENTNYNYVPTYTGPGHASVFTGTTPATHGIIGNNWYSRKEKRNVYCAEDKAEQTVGSSSKAGQMSPRKMLSPSLADALKISTINKSKSVGIALKDRGAILPAGHSANAAYWFDDLSGSWVSSTYYMNSLPKWVSDFNKNGTVNQMLKQDWNTLLPISEYTESWKDDNSYETLFKGELKPVFPHMISQLASANGNYSILKTTPMGNTLTMEFAREAIVNEEMGRDEFTDILTLSFSSTDYVGHAFGTGSIELEDTYLRLDKDLGIFLRFLDKEIGLSNVLIFLTADHGAMDNYGFLKESKIPTGLFNDSIAEVELKKMLSKNFGDSLFNGFINQQVYLNHDIINSRKLDLNLICKSVIDFFLNIDGVSFALKSEELSTSFFVGGMQELVQKGFYPSRSGDVAVVYSPNWLEWGSTGTSHGSGYSYDTHVPLLFFGMHVPHGSTLAPVQITDIAATVSRLAGFPAPAGCVGNTILMK